MLRENKAAGIRAIKTMAQAVKKLVKYIQKYCPNAKTIIRHFDVTGKQCLAGLIDEKKWQKFKSKIK